MDRGQKLLAVRARQFLALDATAIALVDRARLDAHRAIDDVGRHMRRAAKHHIHRDEPAGQGAIDDGGLGLDGAIDRAALADGDLARGEIAGNAPADMNLAGARDVALDAKAFAQDRWREAALRGAAAAVICR